MFSLLYGMEDRRRETEDRRWKMEDGRNQNHTYQSIFSFKKLTSGMIWDY